MHTIKKAILALLIVLSLTACSQKVTQFSLQRVAVTGASVTAGWGQKTPPIKGSISAYKVTMKNIMEGMIATPHDEVGYFGDMMFFNDPAQYGTKLIDQVIAYDPTLVVAIDFMFWFGYDSTIFTDDLVAYKMKSFEYGLQLLDKIQVPIIVGDIPDMHAAIGAMLSSRQVPDAATIANMNMRLRRWAKRHPNVLVVNLHDLVEDLMNDAEIHVYKSVWPAGSQPKLLQKDMLHPTFQGAVAMSLMIPEILGDKGLETDPAIIMQRAAASARSE